MKKPKASITAYFLFLVAQNCQSQDLADKFNPKWLSVPFLPAVFCATAQTQQVPIRRTGAPAEVRCQTDINTPQNVRVQSRRLVSESETSMENLRANMAWDF